jgi:alanyl-tRNA synthetase
VTIKIYQRDAYARTCASTVTAHVDDGGRRAVALAETVFYPAAGGQPPDHGHLDGLAVVDVREDADVVWHAVELSMGRALPAIGTVVTGTIDWQRRFDHMQQHTGQHILSQAFLRVADAATVSVHMDRTCTLDLAVQTLDDDTVSRVETLANTIVMEARPISVRTVDSVEADALGLRRPPKQTGPLRIVEVADFDRSACGGTHVRTAGEVGAIVIRGWERYKGNVRAQFLCGWRVWAEFRRMQRVLGDLGGRLTTGDADLPAAVARLQDHARSLERQLAEARAVALEHEADRLVDEARTRSATGDPGAPLDAQLGAPLVIALAFPERSIEEARQLARALTTRASCVVAVAVDPGRRLLVARSADVSIDAASVLREALAAHGGRGGGQQGAAEGAAPSAPSAQVLADAAAESARRALRGAGH